MKVLTFVVDMAFYDLTTQGKFRHEFNFGTKKLIVFQMEFDKTKWSCWWNSAEIWLSYHLHVHIDIMLCLKGRVLRLSKTVHKTLPGALKHSV